MKLTQMLWTERVLKESEAYKASSKSEVLEVMIVKIVEVEDRATELIEQLLNVWESSVKSTHLFLSDDEI